jgi:hypothetical protein
MKGEISINYMGNEVRKRMQMAVAYTKVEGGLACSKDKDKDKD